MLSDNITTTYLQVFGARQEHLETLKQKTIELFGNIYHISVVFLFCFNFLPTEDSTGLT